MHTMMFRALILALSTACWEQRNDVAVSAVGIFIGRSKNAGS
jgi:hypothetical protein